MDLTVASTTKERPTTSRATGRREDPMWGELAQIIKAQKPGAWVTYEEFTRSAEGNRVGLRLRQKDNYTDGKAFSILADEEGNPLVKVSIMDREDTEDGTTATLVICYDPKFSPLHKVEEKPAPRRRTRAAGAKTATRGRKTATATK